MKKIALLALGCIAHVSLYSWNPLKKTTNPTDPSVIKVTAQPVNTTFNNQPTSTVPKQENPSAPMSSAENQQKLSDQTIPKTSNLFYTKGSLRSFKEYLNFKIMIMIRCITVSMNSIHKNLILQQAHQFLLNYASM